METLVAERRRPVTVVDGDKVPLNEGLLLWQQAGASTPGGRAAPQCAVLDVLSAEYRPLMTRLNTATSSYASRRPTALLFWSQRSASSRKYLGWFVDFARHHVLLVCTGLLSILHMQSLVKFRYVVFGRPYYRSSLWYTVSSVCLSSSVCRLSVMFCIVAKRCVLAKKCLKE